jgi:serine/threonine protein kinase
VVPSQEAGGASSPGRSRLLALVQSSLADRYQVEREIGHGGMAVVFLAHRLDLPRPVALKVMRPEKGYEDGFVERFRSEAHAIAQLHHPHIIGVHAKGEQGEVLWFEMDYVDGGSLDTLIAAGPMEPRRAARFLAQAASGLAHAHAHQMVHRDIKPSNLLFAKDTDHLVITDFGIAKILGNSTLTETGMTIGTIAYMSPEQLASGRGLSPAADQYALGVVAYEMVAGCRPFNADTPGQFAVAQVTQPLPPLLSKAPRCPPDLAKLIERMLTVDPGARWPNLHVIKTAAEEIALTGSAPSLLGVPFPRRPRRRRAYLWQSAAVLVLAGAPALWWMHQRRISTAATPVSQAPAPQLSAVLPAVSEPAVPPPPSPATLTNHKVLAPPSPQDLGQPRLHPDSATKTARVDSALLPSAPVPVAMAAVLPHSRADSSGPSSSPVTTPTQAVIALATRYPGTIVYIGDSRTPIGDSKSPHRLTDSYVDYPVAPGIVTFRLLTKDPDCRNRDVIDTVQIGIKKQRLLSPDCSN